MTLCSDGHPEVCYDERTCPACDLQEKINDLEKEIKDMQSEIEKLDDQVIELENEKE